MDCALSVLASGEQGSIRWKIAKENGAEHGQLHAVGDGTAFSFRRIQDDLTCEIGPLIRRALAEPVFFSDCATKTSALERFNCIRGAFVGAPLETCFDLMSCDGP